MKQNMTILMLLLLVFIIPLNSMAFAETVTEQDPIEYHWHIDREGDKRLLIDPNWFCDRLESMGYAPITKDEQPLTVVTAEGIHAFEFIPETVYYEYTQITRHYYPAKETFAELQLFAEKYGILSEEGVWQIHEGELMIKADAGIGFLEAMGYVDKERGSEHIVLDETSRGYARNGVMYTPISFSLIQIDGEMYMKSLRLFHLMEQVATTIGIPPS